MPVNFRFSGSEVDSGPEDSPQIGVFFQELTGYIIRISRITHLKDVLQAGTLILKENAIHAWLLLVTHLCKICPTIHVTH